MAQHPCLGTWIVGLALGAAYIGTSASASAFEVKITSKGELVHWEERTVEYTLDSSIDANVAEGTNATLRAMGSWSNTVGAPDLEQKARDDESPKAPSFDHKNGVFFVKGGYTPAGRALAITVLTYDNVSGRIMDADVIVNGIYNFKVLPPPNGEQRLDSAPLPSNTDVITHVDEGSNNITDVYDLHHVVAHELGHSLGMNDELQKTTSLMYRYSEPNDATMRQPAADDIAGLAELYATRVDAHGNGCGSSTVSPKKPSGAASMGATFAALALLLFLGLRARSSRRSQALFVVASATAAVALLPSLSRGRRGPGVAGAATLTETGAHARARVLTTTTSMEQGLFKTRYQLATTDCALTSCPKSGYGDAWGGTIGTVTQDVGNEYAPRPGDDVDVSFTTTSVKSILGTMSNPLAARPTTPMTAAVRVLTKASR